MHPQLRFQSVRLQVSAASSYAVDCFPIPQQQVHSKRFKSSSSSNNNNNSISKSNNSIKPIECTLRCWYWDEMRAVILVQAIGCYLNRRNNNCIFGIKPSKSDSSRIRKASFQVYMNLLLLLQALTGYIHWQVSKMRFSYNFFVEEFLKIIIQYIYIYVYKYTYN